MAVVVIGLEAELDRYLTHDTGVALLGGDAVRAAIIAFMMGVAEAAEAGVVHPVAEQFADNEGVRTGWRAQTAGHEVLWTYLGLNTILVLQVRPVR